MQTTQTGNFFLVNLDLFYFLGLFTFSRVKMPSSLAPGSQRINASSKKFSKNFDQKTIHRGSSHLMGVFCICLLGDSKVHFGFAVYEISELEYTMNSHVTVATQQTSPQVCQSGSVEFA